MPISKYIQTAGAKVLTQVPKRVGPTGAYVLFQRPSLLTEAERLGIPKGERSFTKKPFTYGEDFTRRMLSEWNETPRLEQPSLKEVLAESNSTVRDRMLAAREIWQHDQTAPMKNQVGRLKRRADIETFNTNLKEFAESLSSSNPKFQTINIDENTIQRNPYIKYYRQYLLNTGYDAADVSDEQLAKVLTYMDQHQRAGMTGALKETPPLWHGSRTMFDEFDYSKIGSNTGNTGTVGPGNYFSTYGALYGFDKSLGRAVNLQPYYITDIDSMPNGLMMQAKGILPSVLSEKQIEIYPEVYQKIINTNIPGQNTTLFLDPSERVPGIFNTVKAGAMLRRNTGIKSLFPDPSRFIRGASGKVELLPTDWKDGRINFKQGGKLKYIK